MRIRPRAAGASIIAAGALLVGAVTAGSAGAADPVGQVTVQATGGVTTGFTAETNPEAITVGPDGLLWFLEGSGGHDVDEDGGNAVTQGLSGQMSGSIARRNADGTISEFDDGLTGSSLNSIAAGPDGNLWFTEFNPPGIIGRITTSGQITEVLIGGQGGFPEGNVQDIVAGPDGNLWVTRPFLPAVVRVTPGGAFTSFAAPAGAEPRSITVGPDGNLWVTSDSNGGEIYTLGTDGVFTLVAAAGVTPGFSAGSYPGDITDGPDGNLWFVRPGGVGRVTTAGVVTEFDFAGIGGDQLVAIAAGCDSVWVTQGIEAATSAVWRVAVDGSSTQYTAGIAAGSSPAGITEGPDDNMWFTTFLGAGGLSSIGTGCGTAPTTTTTTPGGPTTTAAPGTRPAQAVRAQPAFTG